MKNIPTITPQQFSTLYAQESAAQSLTGYLVNVQTESHGPCTIPKALNAYYALLNCRLIAMPSHIIGARRGRLYTIICDKVGRPGGPAKFSPRENRGRLNQRFRRRAVEALLVDRPKISAIDNLGRPMLAGNLFIVRVDADGNTLSLTQDDLDYLENFVQLQGTLRHPTPYPMLHQCGYA